MQEESVVERYARLTGETSVSDPEDKSEESKFRNGYLGEIYERLPEEDENNFRLGEKNGTLLGLRKNGETSYAMTLTWIDQNGTERTLRFNNTNMVDQEFWDGEYIKGQLKKFEPKKQTNESE